MPRYFFHIHENRPTRDVDGVTLASDDEARSQAVITAGEMLKEKGDAFWTSGEWRMDVADEAGVVVCSLRLTGRSGPGVTD